MEWTLGTNVAFISFLYLSLVTSSALGKCGRYKHVCYGGNGKRSDPSFNLSPSSSSAASSINLRHPSLLSKILVSNDDHLSEKKFVSANLELYEDGDSARTLGADEKINDSSCRSKLQKAIVELIELRKYVAILEGMLRVSGPDLE
ncbi:hypothetical protein RRG08_008195 [Elysia crispata]|uniref:Uncharacterized protein n=1 Tax=Elysia crispata TaxID=231223 RepID=A0AAE0YJW9_9GAST|nr:hypothetical protein RRG08_008195 [Elysia crispata]